MHRRQSTDTPPPRTRPRNRRALILGAAAELFADRGYENVSMSDVANAMNVQPSALYTHFRGKQDLLAAAIAAEFAPARELIAERRHGGFDALLRGLATFSLDHRGLGILWQRESRNLDDDQHEDLREHIRGAVTAIANLLGERRPQLSRQRAELLAPCMVSVLLSSGQHRLALPRPTHDQLMAELCQAVLDADPLWEDDSVSAPTVGGSLPLQSRREALLETATSLFATRSYATTSVHDIGVAAGITGPSVYRHFSSKVEMLAAATTRAIAGLRIELSRVLAVSPDARTALHDLVGTYVEFAFAHSALIDVLASEVSNLPADLQRETRHAIQEYVGEWAHLLRSTAQISDVPARIRILATLSMINDVARTPHLRGVAGIDEVLRTAGTRILIL